MRLSPQRFAVLQMEPLMVFLTLMQRRGYSVYFVGGVVRDALLGLDTQDVDISTDAPMDVVYDALRRRSGYPGSPFAGVQQDKRYGVVSFIFYHGFDKIYVQIAPFRRDVKNYGRHADIKLTHDWKLDARRRDFTINALYVDLNGTLHDDVRGLDDLWTGRIKFIGLPFFRIREDYLRILRMYRFWGRYGRVGLTGFSRLCCRLFKNKLKTVSNERIRAEMFKILMTKRATDVISILNRDGLSRILFGGNVDPVLFSRVVHSGASVLLRLYVCCAGRIPNLIRFVLTRDEKKYYNNLRKCLYDVTSTNRARLFLYGRDVCMDWAILRGRKMDFSMEDPDFTPIRSYYIQKWYDMGRDVSTFGTKIDQILQIWLQSDTLYTVEEIDKILKDYE